MMKYQLNRLRKMKAIRDNHFWIIRIDGNHHGSAVRQRIDIRAIDDGPDAQKAQQGLVLTGNDDIVRWFYLPEICIDDSLLSQCPDDFDEFGSYK